MGFMRLKKMYFFSIFGFQNESFLTKERLVMQPKEENDFPRRFVRAEKDHILGDSRRLRRR